MLLHLIDFVIAITLVEAAVLVLYHRRSGRGVAPQDLIPALCAGLALMLTVRAALSDAPWSWIAAGVLVAGLAHVVDLRRRWQGREPPRT